MTIQRIVYFTPVDLIYNFDFGTDYGTAPMDIAAQGAVNTAAVLQTVGVGHQYIAAGTSSTTPIE